MPMIPVEAIFRTIAEQDAQIKELKQQIIQLKCLLEEKNQQNLVQELAGLVNDYPEKLQNPLIVSTEIH